MRYRLALHCAVAFLPTLAQAQVSAPNPAQAVEIARKHLVEAGAAAENCNWADAQRLAVWARENLPYAGDAWFDALYHEAGALYRMWRPEELLGCMRLAMAARSDRERTGSINLVEKLEPPTPHVLGRELAIEVMAVHMMQSEGQHELALTYLHGVLDVLQSSQVEGARALGARALLDAAWGERARGNAAQALAAFTELRDGFSQTSEAAIAIVMLEQESGTAGGPAAYRGKYTGDPRQSQRIEAVRAAIPGARRRLAKCLRRDEGSIPACPVGVADFYASAGGNSAITMTDLHCPSIPPVVIVFSEGLALSAEDIEQILVHELAHATLSVELGARYGELPVWVAESISEWAAGQWESMADHVLALRLLSAPERFGSGGFWVREPPMVVTQPCGDATVASGLALWKILYEPDKAMPQLLDKLRGRIAIEACVRDLVGGGDSPALFANRQLELHLDERRMPSVPPVTKLLEAKAKSPAALLLACDEILAAGPPVIAQGFALWQRAKALESLNRMAEALAAFDELHRHRLDHPAYVENARIGRARCLMALGKRDDAVVELTALAQDAFSKDVATWATKKSEELEGQRAKQH